MPFAQIGDGSFHYQVEGHGDAVTLVHGVGADLESWDRVVPRLAPHFRVMRYDQRGHGESAKLPGPYSLADLVGDLKSMLDACGLEKTHLVGFSLGGLVAQSFALAYPERLDRLVLISTIAGRSRDEQSKAQARARTLSQNGAAAHLSAATDRWFTDAFRLANPELLEWRRQKSLNNDPQCYAAAYRVLADNDLADDLHRILAPTLVMTGACDIGSTPRMATLMAERIPDARLQILPDLKHAVLLEAPDRIAEEIMGFVKSDER